MSTGSLKKRRYWLYLDACYSFKPLDLMGSGQSCCIGSVGSVFPRENCYSNFSWLIHTLFLLNFKMETLELTSRNASIAYSKWLEQNKDLGGEECIKIVVC